MVQSISACLNLTSAEVGLGPLEGVRGRDRERERPWRLRERDREREERADMFLIIFSISFNRDSRVFAGLPAFCWRLMFAVEVIYPAFNQKGVLLLDS